MCSRVRSSSTSVLDKAFPTERVGACERLPLDAIAGRLEPLRAQRRKQQAWRWVEPILDSWPKTQRPQDLHRR